MTLPAPYYQDKYITLYCGDCREIVPEFTEMFDLLLTDPPYGLGIAANPFRQKFNPQSWDNRAASLDALMSGVNITKQQIIWGGNFFALPPSQGFLVWDKIQPQDFSSAMCEQAWWSEHSPAKIHRERVTSYSKEHPTQKPLALMKWCIQLAGDVKTILDPFAGSGTTGRAAKDLGLKCTLIEREKKYCEIIARRMAQEVFDFSNLKGV